MSPIARPLALTIDCRDPRSLISFWQQLVGGNLVADSPADYLVLENVPMVGMMGFQEVPEAKQVKNRVHLDLEVSDIEEALHQVPKSVPRDSESFMRSPQTSFKS